MRKFLTKRNMGTVAFFAVMLCAAGVFTAGTAHAIGTVPLAGSLAFSLYDIFVNQILLGPVGWVGAIAALAYGGILTAQGNYPLAIPALLGGVIILKADAIIASLGMLI